MSSESSAHTARNQLDRFTERMAAINGSRPCARCRLIVPLVDLDTKDVCSRCHLTGFVRRNRIAKFRDRLLARDNVGVYVDASYRDGIAGLGVAGLLGDHMRYVKAAGNNPAEIAALKWALHLAEQAAARNIVFHTDSQHAYIWFLKRDRGFGWSVVQIPRNENKRADRLARNARVLGEGR